MIECPNHRPEEKHTSSSFNLRFKCTKIVYQIWYTILYKPNFFDHIVNMNQARCDQKFRIK